MIEMHVYDYQPGTGTRHLLLCGLVATEKDVNALCCQKDGVLLVWVGKGAYPFTEGVTEGYLAEKFGLQDYMVDARALKNFVLHQLNKPMDEDYKACPVCNVPYLTTNRY